MSAGLDRRLAALARAAELADGRLDAAAVARARSVVERAGARSGLGLETTVVALAGPTGAGKSTLFNALAGRDLAQAGVRRPTTSSVTAAVWGDPDPALLDWLGATTRHAVGPGSASMAGDLVLLDLPDYDSVDAAHRTEVERIIELVDLLVWVVDPQKYADGALHERYLRPLAAHGAVMVAVLNQADRLEERALAACRTDLSRLLADDGLTEMPVLALSATSGYGLPALVALLRERAAARAAAVQRLGADAAVAARSLSTACEGRGGPLGRAARERVVAALADAAGVPAVARAAARSHRRQGALAAGWPLARWLRRLRPDPLRRLRLGEGEGVHTSLPGPTAIQRSSVSSAVRSLAAEAAGELPAPWPGLVRRAATASEDALPAALDRAAAGTPLPSRRPLWWRGAGGVQIALACAALVGALWLAALAVLGYLRIADIVGTPDVIGLPLPTLLILGGLLGGIVLALLARWINGFGAARRGRRVERAMRERVEAVADEHVLAPVIAELGARDDLCQALRDVTG